MHADWPYKADLSLAALPGHHMHHQDPPPDPIHETHIMEHHKIHFGPVQRI